MNIIEFFKKLPFAERLTLLTTILLLIGFSYKIGYFASSEVDILFIIQYFSFSDLIYTSLQLLIVFVVLIVTFNKILVIYKAERNIYVFGIILIVGSVIAVFFNDYLTLYIALIFGLFFSLLYFHNTTRETLIFLFMYILILPFLVGIHNYSFKIKNNKLPKASIKMDEGSKEEWLILDKIGDKTLLMNKLNTREFKVVNLDTLDKINF
ncbi:hypothetical protein [Acinetobacter bereziniae]|uniref:hypothetical protein n=1 Tax=Acinetobacter bereziniae TaxID=106648 RepID=UPI001250B257|nr:hypothetical protein [Acinetobacter bereziniae]